MTALAIFVLFHACAGQAIAVADRRANYLLALVRSEPHGLNRNALSEMVDVCTADAIIHSIDEIQPSVDALQCINNEIAHKEARRRFWHRIWRLGL